MPTAEEFLKVAGSSNQPSRGKALPRYQPSFGLRLTPATRKLFEEYSGIPQAEVDSHIYKIVSPYPHYCGESSNSFIR